VAIKSANVKVTINDFDVVEADVPAFNGVAHAIDAVLTPPEHRRRTLDRGPQGAYSG
jgi:uncharacterized surface protein with fasciclin (FAS1) repeats